MAAALSPRHAHRACPVLGALLLCLLLGACAGHRPDRPDPEALRRFASHGYTAADQHEVRLQSLQWNTPAGPVDLSLALPAGPGPYPLVVYLPGLGEGAGAGLSWRRAWAQAGYAVLGVQPLAEDARAWMAEPDHPGEVAPQARLRYAPAVMRERLERLAAILSELQRRRLAGEPGLGAVDTTRVALAGFDLGGYSAMVAAGEALRESTVPPLPLVVSCVADLEPFADFSGVALTERYAAVRVPVLGIAAGSGEDPLGVVESASMRRAPFRYMPAGGKYLLVLGGATHALLAGEARDAGPAHDDATAPTPAKEAVKRSRQRRAPTGEGQPAPPSPTQRAIAAQAVQVASLAFLDAHLRKDPVALEWLERDAARWIAGHGEWQRR